MATFCAFSVNACEGAQSVWLAIDQLGYDGKQALIWSDNSQHAHILSSLVL